MTSALSIHNLYKTYSNGFEALKGISLDVAQGDFFALLGPNGAGKSTTIGIICSLINKSDGDITVFEYNMAKQLEQAKRCIGLVPQEFNFNVFEPVEEILINQAGYYGVNRKVAKQQVEYYLQKLGLWDKRKDGARLLSGGMKRRLMIARALVHQPKLLILDEPTAGVDIEIRYSMWEFLKQINEQGTTVILTTHYLEEAENLCRNIAIIDEGQIIENTSMQALLYQLKSEVFILNTVEPIYEEFKIEEFHVSKIDELTLEVEIRQGQHINQLFNQLDNLGVRISSMRNKTNRLEQLFMKLVSEST